MNGIEATTNRLNNSFCSTAVNVNKVGDICSIILVSIVMFLT